MEKQEDIVLKLFNLTLWLPNLNFMMNRVEKIIHDEQTEERQRALTDAEAQLSSSDEELQFKLHFTDGGRTTASVDL